MFCLVPVQITICQAPNLGQVQNRKFLEWCCENKNEFYHNHPPMRVLLCGSDLTDIKIHTLSCFYPDLPLFHACQFLWRKTLHLKVCWHSSHLLSSHLIDHRVCMLHPLIGYYRCILVLASLSMISCWPNFVEQRLSNWGFVNVFVSHCLIQGVPKKMVR